MDALLTIGPDHGVYDYGTGTAWRGGQGIIRLHRNTGTLNLETFDDPGVIGITIMDLSARGAGRALSPSPGADVRFADIADALLDLSLADGYTPDVDKTFTLLRADTTLSGATQGGSLFQYTDGYDEITVGSSLFRIDWAEGSEQIVLTVIPEPGSLLLMALAGAGLIALRRGQRRSH